MTERANNITIVGVAGIGMIHLLDSIDTFHETRWLFWAYVLLMAATLVVSGALLYAPDSRWLAAAALVALLPLAGYILSRTTGLPGADDDVGNWTDPLGLASLWVEGAVLATSTAALALAPRRAPAPARPLTINPLEN
jgi:hypothetical protein